MTGWNAYTSAVSNARSQPPMESSLERVLSAIEVTNDGARKPSNKSGQSRGRTTPPDGDSPSRPGRSPIRGPAKWTKGGPAQKRDNTSSRGTTAGHELHLHCFYTHSTNNTNPPRSSSSSRNARRPDSSPWTTPPSSRNDGAQTGRSPIRVGG